MKKISIAVLLSAFAAAPAFAVDLNGVYVGVNVGRASTNASNLLGNTDTAIAGVVGYTINKNVSAEVQCVRLGTINTSPNATSVSLMGCSATAVGSLPFAEHLSGYGKLGLSDTNYNAPGYITNRIAITWGLGGQFNVNKDIGIRFGYDSYGIGDSTTKTATTGVISVGAIKKF